VFENRVLKKTFEPKKDEVTGDWRNLHVKKFRALYFSQNILRVIKSRRLRRPGGGGEHLECMVKENVYKVSVSTPEGRDQ
jgi:hypothetical protein